MGFLGDLFATKGTVEIKTTVIGLPAGMSRFYKLGFVAASRPGAPPPKSAKELRWTSLTEDFTLEKSLPVGHWQVQALVNPALSGTRPDPTRAVAFWPLDAAFEVKKGETTKIRLEIAFPKAGLDGLS